MSEVEVERHKRQALQALRHPRGRYSAERASQLSGVPASTLYEWQRHNVYKPDFVGATPIAWSYRDLVFVRLLAWLRQVPMERSLAAGAVASLKQRMENGEPVQFLYATPQDLVTSEDGVRLEGTENLLPFDNLADLLAVFDLTEPIEDFGRNHLWGPNLIEPSEHTTISPWVLGGDPCIQRSRVPTATIFALHDQRGLDTGEIVNLYPGLTADAVEDAYNLERRLRAQEDRSAA